MTYLDTHAAVWLAEGRIEKFPAAALSTMEQNPLFLSPMVVLEFQYLFEIKRICVTAQELKDILFKDYQVCICTVPFSQIVMESLPMDWTRDPFDRLIVAHAMTRDAALISKDTTIQKTYSKTIWE